MSFVNGYITSINDCLSRNIALSEGTTKMAKELNSTNFLLLVDAAEDFRNVKK